MSQFKTGAVLSYVNLFLTNVGGLIITPMIVRSLGNSEYGLYALMGSTIAYLTLLDFGLNNAITRYLSTYLASGENVSDRISHFLGNVTRLFGAIVLLILAVGGIVYTQLDAMYGESLTVDQLEKAKIMFLFLLLNVAVTVPGGAFQAIATAYQQFNVPRILSIFKYTLRIILILVILKFGADGLGLIILDTLLNIVVIGCMILYTRSKIRFPFQFSTFDTALVKELFMYSFWVFLYGFVHFFQWTGGQIILGMTTNTAQVALFAMGIMLAGFYNAYGGVINSMLMPKAALLIKHQNDPESITREVTRFARLSAIPMFLIFTGFIVFGKLFILLWLNADYIEAYYFAVLIMTSMTLLILQMFSNSILESLRKNRFKSIFSLVSVSLALVIGYQLAPTHGGYGIIIPLASAIGLNGIVMCFYHRAVFGLKLSYFLSQVLVKQVLVFTPLVFLFVYGIQYVGADTWLALAFWALIYTVLYLSCTYFFLLTANERESVRTLIDKIRTKIKR